MSSGWSMTTPRYPSQDVPAWKSHGEEVQQTEGVTWPVNEEQWNAFFLECIPLLSTAVDREIYSRQADCVAKTSQEGVADGLAEAADVTMLGEETPRLASSSPSTPFLLSTIIPELSPPPSDSVPAVISQVDVTMIDPSTNLSLPSLPLDVLDLIAEALDGPSFASLLEVERGIRMCLAEKWFRRMGLLRVDSAGVPHLVLRNVPHIGWSILPFISRLARGPKSSWELRVDVYYLIKKPTTIWRFVQHQPRLDLIQVNYTPQEMWTLNDPRLPRILRILHDYMSSQALGFHFRLGTDFPMWLPYESTPPSPSIIIALDTAINAAAPILQSSCIAFNATLDVFRSAGLVPFCQNILQSPNIICLAVDDIPSQEGLDFISQFLSTMPSRATSITSLSLTVEAPMHVVCPPSLFAPFPCLNTFAFLNHFPGALTGPKQVLPLPRLDSLTISPIFHSVVTSNSSHLTSIHLLLSQGDEHDGSFCSQLLEDYGFLVALGQVGLRDVSLRISVPSALRAHLQMGPCSCPPNIETLPSIPGINQLAFGIRGCNNAVDGLLLRLGLHFPDLRQLIINSLHDEDETQNNLSQGPEAFHADLRGYLSSTLTSFVHCGTGYKRNGFGHWIPVF
ncbi:hypothetical protein BKA70DRAFT_1239521 [Coprinopsis sp. MPI-PUGE-AT-0042]|nr:hypothetical protein BKA70DRAFT_1239521 [Coprinopsis sp. MPI-PUGE-AT-0042]